MNKHQRQMIKEAYQEGYYQALDEGLGGAIRLLKNLFRGGKASKATRRGLINFGGKLPEPNDPTPFKRQASILFDRYKFFLSVIVILTFYIYTFLFSSSALFLILSLHSGSSCGFSKFKISFLFLYFTTFAEFISNYFFFLRFLLRFFFLACSLRLAHTALRCALLL